MSERQDKRSRASAPGLGRSPSQPSAVSRASASSAAAAQSATPEPGIAGTRLKVVTLDPATFSGAEPESPPSERLLKLDPYLGATVDGRYKVEAIVGEGGMGVVYRCSHAIIGKKVAMKVLRADLARDAEVTERFLNEARAASAIGNPHIIDISDFGRFPDGATYFVMEFLAGAPLSQILDALAPLPLARILHVARQLAVGLEAAHTAGIVHRDLKPDNIFLIQRGAEEDFVKILDFGIAKVSSAGGGRLTRAGAVFGSPHYMCPEQAAGAPVDHRGDVYSLGVILYEMCTGMVPFDSDNFMGILSQHIHKEPVPPSKLVAASPELPPGLERVILKCLRKRAEARYQSMQTLIADLDRLALGEPPVVALEPTPAAPAAGAVAQRTSSMPAGQASGGAGKRWALVAVAAAALVTVSLALTSLGKAPLGEASSRPPVLRVEALEPAAAPAHTQPAAAVNVPSPVQQVVLAVEPIDAHVFHASRDLGTSPVILQVPRGSQLQLEIRRQGYKTRTWLADGSSPRQTVKLERAVQRRPAAAERARAQVKPAGAPRDADPGAGGIVNPWDK